MNKKILLVKLLNKNLGDHCVADATEFFLKKAFPFWQRDHVQIIPYSIQSEDYDIIKYVDMVVFAGGGLITFGHSRFYEYLSEITNICEQYKIPVFFNSVGVEGYDENDERCRVLKMALNRDCVKCITIRDDFATFQNSYITNPNIYTDEVFDTAAWIREVYKDCFDIVKTDKIGIGIGRAELFYDYGHEAITKQDVLQYWKDVTGKLEEKGFEWEIFTNGLPVDEQFAKEVLEEIGHGTMCPMPVKGKHLAHTISSYKGIIACRMHSNIIAYSYGVPSIGMIWNEKIRFWGDKISRPERFLEADALDAGETVSRLIKALAEKPIFPARAEKKRIAKAIKKFVKYDRGTEIQKPDFELSKKLYIQALGDKDFTYTKMNAGGQLSEIVGEGAVIVEVDVSLTSDGHLVCVNGWGLSTYKKLMIYKEGINTEPLDLEMFQKLKYYGRYPTITFPDFLREYCALSKENRPLVLIHLHEKKEESREVMYGLLFDEMSKWKLAMKRFLISAEYREDLPFIKSKKGARILYYLSSEGKNLKDDLKFLKKEHISRIMLEKDMVNDGIIKRLETDDVNVFVGGISTLSEIESYLSMSKAIRAVGVSNCTLFSLSK